MNFTAAIIRGNNARFARLGLGIILVLQLSACGMPTQGGNSGPETTYEKFLPLAEAGDAESQNVIGFMLFHGEGVTMDRDRAVMWFWRAAKQGNVRAQRNLEMVYSAGSSAHDARSLREATDAATQELLSGEGLYAKFCAGCHGFNGIAAYVYSPSFALGQTLEKSDDDLMRSLLHGKGEMPDWDGKLSRAELQAVLRFVRTLQLRYDLGVAQRLRGAPDLYFLFGPMQWNERVFRAPIQ